MLINKANLAFTVSAALASASALAAPKTVAVTASDGLSRLSGAETATLANTQSTTANAGPYTCNVAYIESDRGQEVRAILMSAQDANSSMAQLTGKELAAGQTLKVSLATGTCEVTLK